MLTFDDWVREVDGLCRKHLRCSWAELAGDIDPLERGYRAGDSPRQFVEWLAAKYDLTWVDAAVSSSGTSFPPH